MKRHGKRERKRARQQRRVERRARGELDHLQVRDTPARAATDPIKGVASTAIDQALHWHVARMAPRWTAKIGTALNKIEASAFLPRASQVVVRRNRRVVRRTPMLPKAIFVGVRDAAHLDRVAAHAGIEMIVSYPVKLETTGNVEAFEMRPARIDPKVLQNFIDAVATGEIVEPVGVRPGSNVLIKEGPFSGFPGIVEEILPSDRVKVGVAIFGRSSPCELDLAQVQAVD